MYLGLTLAALVIGWQLLNYADAGHWQPVSIVDVLYWFHQAEWLYEPRAWIGIHRLLSALPGALFIAACGAILSGFFAVLADDFK